jgi:hypothetical protein
MHMNSHELYIIPINREYSNMIEKMNTGTTVFEENAHLTPVQVPGDDKKKFKGYVPWGDDNLRPLEIINLQRKDEVISSNQFFNILAGYGSGVKFSTPEGDKVTDQEVVGFFKYNRSCKYLLEQMTDMKHFFFTVSVIILNGEGSKIVRLVHKEAMYCRFETCNDIGVSEHVFFGDWEKPSNGKFEVIEMLDLNNPLGDLMVRMGKLPNAEGVTGKPTTTRKFAIVNKIPTPGNSYYPFPYHWAIFNSGWFDIKQMIPTGKKAKFKNGLVTNYQVEINQAYWKLLFESERITDPAKQEERKKKEKENIKSFLLGIENSGKVWFTGFYVDPMGKENRMVRIEKVNSTKEGGDWIEDTEEASNMECYAQGVHPSLIGATPGKTKGSFSGSDKRELFTMKQALEKAVRDIILEPYFVIKEFNGWNVDFEIPFVMLTTLDKKADAKEVTQKTEE